MFSKCAPAIVGLIFLMGCDPRTGSDLDRFCASVLDDRDYWQARKYDSRRAYRNAETAEKNAKGCEYYDEKYPRR